MHPGRRLPCNDQIQRSQRCAPAVANRAAPPCHGLPRPHPSRRVGGLAPRAPLPWPPSPSAAAAPSSRSPDPGGGPGADAADFPLVPGEVLNKVPVALGMTPRLYGYLLQHTREPEVLRRLRRETAAVSGCHMQITPEQGALLGLLVELTGARRVVEVGVFTGYSSCAMAMALPPDGRLVALERDERPLQVARCFWQQAGVGERVEAVVGPAAGSLEQLLQRDGPDSYDMAFIDADKRSYDTYYELLLRLVRPGGLIAIDNTLFYGRVVEPEASDKAAIALRDLNAKLLTDPRVSISLLPVGDGMTLCRRR